MKRLLYSFLFVVLIPTLVTSQVESNHWVKHNQQYFRIGVARDGLYRVSFAQLSAAGIPLAELDPRNLQVFHNGEEQYIYVAGEQDGIFHSSDYLEFYGEKNSGILDTAFILNQGAQVNPEHSFYNDTACYFLTWNTSWNNRRYTTEQTSINTSLPNIHYVISTVRADYTSTYNHTQEGPYFNEGEGWTDSYFDYGSASSKELQTRHYTKQDDVTRARFCLVSSNSLSHNLTVTGPGFSFDTSFFGYRVINKNIIIANELSDKTRFTAKSTLSQGMTTDKNAWAWLELSYPHSLDFEGKSSFLFSIPSRFQDMCRLEITSFITDSNTVMYNLTEGKRIKPLVHNNICKAQINIKVSSPTYFIVSSNDILSPAYVTPVSSQNSPVSRFTDFSSTDASFIIVTEKSLWSQALHYYNYRRLSGQKAIIVDIDELYNQFGYGVWKHPVAIRNFCSFVIHKSKTRPEYLFLIGKSIHPSLYRNYPAYYAECTVPSGGNPASDQLITWRMNKSSYKPALATGRLVARSAADVNVYLKKIKEYEANTPAEWMKNVLQFGGGKDTWERAIFKNYLRSYQSVFEDTLMGANVFSLFKYSSEPIENSQADVVKQKVNNGVSILNFFGHAAATGFDQNIDLPSSYSNSKKYPLIIASSCYSGDFNNPGVKGLSENWVITPDNGAIGFIAGSESGYASYLNTFTSELVKGITYKFYNQSIGRSIVNAISYNEQLFPYDDYMKFTSLNINLHGDPSLKVNGFDRPDLVTHSSYIMFSPDKITTSIDSFDIRYVVTNSARAFRDTFSVSVKRTYPSGKTLVKKLTLRKALYKDTITVRFPVGDQGAAGQNKLEITLDTYNSINELNETNNSISIDFFITSSSVIPVFPQKFAIYPNQKISFYASSPDPFARNTKTILQVDTSPTFTSSSLYAMQAPYNGGSLRFDYPGQLQNNTTYFWRIGIEKPNNLIEWNKSSFTYIDGRSGWAQAHFNQFEENEYTYIKRNEETSMFSFITTPQQLHCRTIGSANASNWNLVEFQLDGSLLGWSSCLAYPALNVAVFNPDDLSLWKSNKGNYGHRNYPACYSTVNNYLAFSSNDPYARNNLAHFLNDSVPDGCYILVFSFMTPNLASWEESLHVAFDRLGAKQLRTTENDIPFIFLARKGSSTYTKEIIGSNKFSQIDLYQNLNANYSSGSIKSSMVGPAQSWDELTYDIKPKDDLSEYSVVSLLNSNVAGEEIKTADSLVSPVGLNGLIDVRQYPTLKIEMKSVDQGKRTPAQITSWKVYYNPYPEGSLDVNGYSFYADTVQEGESVSLKIGFKNTSLTPMDSVVVKATVTTKNNEILKTFYHYLKPLQPDESVLDSISFSTIHMRGDYRLSVEFNPLDLATRGKLTLESYRFNNLAQKFFHVASDARNPILDVTFDGVHIFDGDIVSAKPSIEMSLKDENKFFALDDTSYCEVYLTDMSSHIEKRVWFSSATGSQLQFKAGTRENNQARISYMPVFEKDGMYMLRVKGRDASGNESGDFDYRISFEVILKSTITNIVNYPNPFSSSTRFVFTLTGSQVPTDLRVQVFTVTGKMVKEISMQDMGAIHVGRNITPQAWDGTDMYGDKLANGVYLYRFFSSINGKSIEHRSSEIDGFYKKGFCKMYLMR